MGNGSEGDPNTGHRVCTAKVLRKRILALFQDRQESEVVVFPRHVYDKHWGLVDLEAVHRYNLRRETKENQ
jgi:hypothetical protein